MRYSEHPHEHYLSNGKGPGAAFVGDLERWNWRWLLRGLDEDLHFDYALSQVFNEAQRQLMKQPPLEALDLIRGFAPVLVTQLVEARAAAAQAGLFPARVAAREDNVIFANFRRRA